MKVNIFGLNEKTLSEFTQAFIDGSADPIDFLSDFEFYILAEILDISQIMKKNDVANIMVLRSMRGAIGNIENDPIRSKLFQPLLDVDERKKLEHELKEAVAVYGKLSPTYAALYAIGPRPQEIEDYFEQQREVARLPYDKKIKQAVLDILESTDTFRKKLDGFSHVNVKFNLQEIQNMKQAVGLFSEYISIGIPKIIEKNLGKDASDRYHEALRKNEHLTHELALKAIKKELTETEPGSNFEGSSEHSRKR